MVGTQEIQLIDFEVDALFFSECLYYGDNILDDLSFAFDIDIHQNFHYIAAQGGKLLTVDVLVIFTLILYHMNQADRQILHKLGNLVSEVEKDSESLDQAVHT